MIAGPGLPLVVDAVLDVAPDIRAFVLRHPSGDPLPSFVPGSHLPVFCGEGRINSYSLTGESGAPETYAISVHHRRDGRGGSTFMHALRVGDRLACGLPRSAFAPVASARHHLMIAGGIGITPFLSHLRAARRWGRSASLLFAVREGAPVPHAAELDALCGDLRVLRGRAAMTAAVEAALVDQPLGTHLYVCGPEAMIDDVLERAARAGWPAERCHAERFGAVLPPGAPFEAILRRTGRRIAVPAEASLLDAVEAAGIPWPSLCRQGVCGECRMEGVEGTILHRDHYLSPAEREAGNCLMPCVSRGAGLITLDL